MANLVYFVSSSHDESRQSRRSHGRADSVSPHLPVDSSVPLPPCLGGGEHAAAPAHVTVCTLTGSVGTSSSNSRNTGHSSASSPRFRTGLMSSFFGYSISLKMSRLN